MVEQGIFLNFLLINYCKTTVIYICIKDYSKRKKKKKGAIIRMRQSEINELKDLAFHKAREFPCEQLLNEAGYMTRTRGDKIFSQCPNCGKIGKKGDSCITHSMFSITKSKNVFSCFSCDFKGGPATLYAHFNNVSYIEACVILAYRLGDITLEQYESINGSTDAIKKFQGDTKVYRMIDEKISEDYTSKAPDDVCNLVYSHLLRMPQFALSKEHRKYLLENRHLTEQEIKDLGFFTYKECFSIDKLILSIRKEYPDFTYNNLLGVPGFFMEYQDDSKSLGRWMFKHPCPECIGIPLKNTIGEIMALQMRNLNQKSANKGMKYFYVSSRNVTYEKLKGHVRGLGSSPGSPVHVFFPTVKKTNTFYVGEGFFKMNEICKDGFTALSIQGVNTFTYVADEVEEIIKQHPEYKKKPLRFMIVFDMDLYEKIQVLDAGINFAKYLHRKFPSAETYFLFWDENLGKGYDDMKFTCMQHGINYFSMLKAHSTDEVAVLVEKAERMVSEQYKIPVEKEREMLRNKKYEKNTNMVKCFSSYLRSMVSVPTINRA